MPARLAEPRDVAILHGAGERCPRDAAMGRRAGQELVEQDPERVEVRATGGRIATPELGRHVQRRPDTVRPRIGPDRGDVAARVARPATDEITHATAHRARHRGMLGRAAVHDPGEPEIEQLGATLVGEDRVRRLHVAVKDPATVRRGEPPREIERDVQDLSPRHRAVELIERAAAHVLGDQVRMSGDLGDPMDRDDVGMRKPGERAPPR
jgi:hypothetical protein